ncbi:hypothetical protein ABEW81_11420 [Priestia megaterium]
MNVKLTVGNLTDKEIHSCYDIIVAFYLKRLQEKEKEDKKEG